MKLANINIGKNLVLILGILIGMLIAVYSLASPQAVGIELQGPGGEGLLDNSGLHTYIHRLITSI